MQKKKYFFVQKKKKKKIYRPPYSEKHPVTLATFLEVFTVYLERVSAISSPLVIMGKFNIHMDNVTDCLLLLKTASTLSLLKII